MVYYSVVFDIEDKVCCVFGNSYFCIDVWGRFVVLNVSFFVLIMYWGMG